MNVFPVLPFLALVASNAHARPGDISLQGPPVTWVNPFGKKKQIAVEVGSMSLRYRSFSESGNGDIPAREVIWHFGEDRVSDFIWDVNTAIEENLPYSYRLMAAETSDDINFMTRFSFVPNSHNEIEKQFDQTAVSALVYKVITDLLENHAQGCASIWATSCTRNKNNYPEADGCPYINVQGALLDNLSTSFPFPCEGWDILAPNMKNWTEPMQFD